ncbi:UvrD-helicase domain-containing protein [bacterium]|nr:UvrD-helicase domain-containing protein [bacterium]
MSENKLIIAAAGSGKTTYLVNQALERSKIDKILITTYTEANEAEIKSKIIEKKKCIPSNISIQTWFSFLLHHGVRPYQSTNYPDLHELNIGFFLSNNKSGGKLDQRGNPLFSKKGFPLYWKEENYLKHYFTSSMRIYSDKVSKFVIRTNEACNNEIINRISRIYSHVYIDEVQDLAGYDLEIIKLLFQSSSSVFLVGDPRQVTYLTHHEPKHNQFKDGKIKDFVLNKLGKRICCNIDESTLLKSHRNNSQICNYSSKLFPEYPIVLPCDCEGCRKSDSSHKGVYLVDINDLDSYLDKFTPIQIRWNINIKVNPKFQSITFGYSKGKTFDRVLIYPTSDMRKWILNNGYNLKNSTRSKLYVGITRARFSVGIVMSHDSKAEITGIQRYVPN